MGHRDAGVSESAVSSPGGRTGVILVVEPSHEMRQLLVELLGRQGYEVIGAEGVSQARQQLRGDRAPDLVIADVDARRGASSLLRWVRAELAATPLILLVGLGDALDEEQALALGASGMMRKPFDFDDLLRQVQRMAA